MEALKTSETLIDEGLVKSKQEIVGNLVDVMSPEVSRYFDLGNGKCVENLSVPVLESSGIDSSTNNVKHFDPLTQPVVVGPGSDIGSSSQGGDTMKGISLFVELTGGVANKVDEVDNVGNANDDILRRNEVKDNVDDFKVNVGDIVWALIKKQRDSWWPGIVCDASSSASKEVVANKPTNENDILVKCFGSGSYFWCLVYNVKPFVGYFEGIPNQSKARRYLDAYEKAVVEFGHRVKTEFTCSCFSKTKVEKFGSISKCSVSEFEPAKFVDNIKDLARDMSMVGKIDYVVKQNCLSAFYRSLGHCQIPMSELKPANGTPTKIKIEEEEEKEAYFNEIRDRKKSTFLAYPGESVKKPGKKRGRKRKEATVCTSEALSQLQFAGQDCLFPFAKDFDSVKSFISGYRKHTFKNLSTEILIEMPNHQKSIPKKVRKKKEKPVVVPPALGNYSNHDSLILDFQNVSLNGSEAQINANRSSEELTGQTPFFHFQPVTKPPVCKLKPIKRKINVSDNGEAQSNANKSTVEVTGQSPFYSFGDQTATGPPLCKLKPIKRKKNVSLNGEAQSSSFFSFGDQPVTGPPPPCKLKPIKKKIKTEPNTSMPTWNYNVGPLPNVYGNVDPYSFHNANGPPNVNPFPFHNASYPPNVNPFPFHNASYPPNVNPFPFHNVSPLPNVNGYVNPFPFHVVPYVPQRNDVEGLKQSGPTPSFYTGNGEPQLGLVPAGLTHEPKNRGRKRKNVYLQADPGSTTIPPSNENGQEPNTAKRVKKSRETGVACIDLSYNKVRQDIQEEVTGTAFLLKFSPDHPLPSNQDLNSVFSKYGALVESETQVLNESLSGQVVFLESSNAGEAFWRLQNDQPFGPALVNYRIQHLGAGAESVVSFKTPINKTPSGFKPMDQQTPMPPMPPMPELNRNSDEVKLVKISKTIEEIRLPPKDNNLVQAIKNTHTPTPLAIKAPQNGEPQNLAGIKKNLEMMKAMMEKAGNTLSSEMRGKLESEIKGLMNKVSIMDGSSSSCL